MPFCGHLDEANEFEIFGWAHHDALPRPVLVDVVINRRLVATVPASGYRPDVGQAGFGDGYKGFCLNPIDHWREASNRVEVFHSGSGRPMADGVREVMARVSEEDRSAMRSAALARWLGGEDDTTIPAGCDSAIVDAVSSRLTPISRVLDLGCGHGRFAEVTEGRGASYLGIDVNAARVERLRDRFRDPGLRFETADCMACSYEGVFDVILMAGVCEYLFPSVAPLLAGLRRVLAPSGALAADFLVYDERMMVARSRFPIDPAPHYARTYARWEIDAMFAAAGFAIVSATKAPPDRFLVLAEPR